MDGEEHIGRFRSAGKNLFFKMVGDCAIVHITDDLYKLNMIINTCICVQYLL